MKTKYFLFFLINFNIFCKALIDNNIKDVFVYESEEVEVEGVKIPKLIENKLEVVENNESTKHNDEYFIAIEFVFDKINKKYVQKNKKDNNLKDFNFEIIINKDGSFEKKFKDKLNNNIKEYEIEGNCGHLFTLKDIDNKEYIIYLTNLYPDVYIFKENKKIVEFRSIYCFGYNINNESLFEDCKNLKNVKYNNFNKNSKDKLIDYLKKNTNDYINRMMFSSCINLTNVDLGNFICNSFTDNFSSLKNLKYIKINNSFDNFTLYGTFYNCKNLKKIDFTNRNKIIIKHNAFLDCENLQNLNIDNIYINDVTGKSFKNCKKIKNLNINFSKSYLNEFQHIEELLEGTNLDNLNIIFEDEYDMNYIDNLEKIFKGAKIKRFTFNNVPINVQDGVNLKEFMLNPIQYLRDNPKYKCDDYDIPNDTQIPPINNTEKIINTDLNDNKKNNLCCLVCCSKCCCCKPN